MYASREDPNEAIIAEQQLLLVLSKTKGSEETNSYYILTENGIKSRQTTPQFMIKYYTVISSVNLNVLPAESKSCF